MADPVSIIVGPIVNNIIDTAASLIKGEFLAILNVEKEVKNLSSNLTAIAAVLKDAEQRQLDAACGASLRDWLGKLKDVVCDAEDILDTFATETFLWNRKQQVRKILAPSNLFNKSSVAHKIKEISARLDLIAEQKNSFHLTESSDGGETPNLPHTPFFEGIPADVFGREPDRDELINRMLSNESDTEGDVSVIPIVGMGGLGKTTLAQLIFKDDRVKNHFEFRMWVHVTVDFNFGRILKEMIEFHTEMKYSNDVPTSTLVSRFLEFLARKNFLLVLDDVWIDDFREWEPLQNLLKQGGKGSRVLVTTRTTRVSEIMGTQPPYRLEGLPENECWSLFEKIAFKDCDSLVGTHRKELEVYGRQIVGKCNGLPLAVKAMGGVLRGCLWLFELPKDLGNLVNLRHLELDDMFWFKCEMLPPRMGNLTSLQNLHSFPVSGTSGHGIEELKNMANLTKTVHISKLENAVNAAEAKLNVKESLQKLVLEWSDKDFNQQDEVTAVRVLKDLQPHSNLKELALHHFKGSNFPLWMTDGLLQNLVTLTLSHCTKCTTLSVGRLPCLRVLYIKGMLELEEWPEVQCLSLGRLHINNCPKLRKVPDLMPNLGVLKIKKCDSLRALPLAPSLLFLILIDNVVLEEWKEGMLIAQDDQGNQVRQPTLIGLLELKMVNCPSIQALPKIFAPQKLEISGCGLITALPVPHFAQRLQHLALDTCSNGTLVGAIPSTNTLYSLIISNISNLTSFPKLPHLPGLKSLYINDCKDLTSLSEEEGSLKSLSSLKLLSIRGCSKLESLPDEGLPTGLECLMIASCPILKSLGTEETLKSLLSLKDLYLEDCPSIRSFPEDGLPTSLLHLATFSPRFAKEE
ncbi:hypothetical protein QUC31_010032 [Theobroma cacao]